MNTDADKLVVDSKTISVLERSKIDILQMFENTKQIKTAILKDFDFSDQSYLLWKSLLKILDLGTKRIQIKNWVIPENLNESDFNFINIEVTSHNLQSFELISWDINESQLQLINRIVES